MKRIVVVSAVLALVGAVVPWNGSAGAAVAPAPDHRLGSLVGAVAVTKVDIALRHDDGERTHDGVRFLLMAGR